MRGILEGRSSGLGIGRFLGVAWLSTGRLVHWGKGETIKMKEICCRISKIWIPARSLQSILLSHNYCCWHCWGVTISLVLTRKFYPFVFLSPSSPLGTESHWRNTTMASNNWDGKQVVGVDLSSITNICGHNTILPNTLIRVFRRQMFLYIASNSDARVIVIR